MITPEIKERLTELLEREELLLLCLSPTLDERIFRMVISNRNLDCLKVTVVDGKAFRFEGYCTRNELECIDYIIESLWYEFPDLYIVESEEEPEY